MTFSPCEFSAFQRNPSTLQLTVLFVLCHSQVPPNSRGQIICNFFSTHYCSNASSSMSNHCVSPDAMRSSHSHGSWNSSAARRVPPTMHHPEMHGRMLPTRRGDYTICFSDICTEWLRRSSLFFTTQCRSLREAIRSCFPCYLHGCKSGSHKDRSVHDSLMWSSNHTFFPTAWCLRTRSYTPNYRKF